MLETEKQDDSATSDSSRVAGDAATLWPVFPGRAEPTLTVVGTGTTLGRELDEPGALAFADARMSRRHATIEWRDGGWQVRDLGSRNGGFVDGVPIPASGSSSLRDGAVIRIGNTLAVFRDELAIDDAAELEAAFPGASNAARSVRRRIQTLAGATGHVLVTGETGVGKERVSRAIADGRKLVVVNCAELTRELVRSELFGHVRGAFSGAVTTHPGLVDIANGGVLFLDEIGELPIDAQADLLRFLEDGGYRPVGSNELQTSTARVVAATNRDLDERVKAGAFRRDLLARLRAANRPVELPTLAERREDILGWASRFVQEALGRELPAETWTPGAVECLLLYAWPDNLRQLRGVARGLVESRTTWPIKPEELPAAISEHRRQLRLATEAVAELAPSAEPTADQVRAALAGAGGNMRLTAEVLRVDRRKLYRLCERFGIQLEPYRKGEGYGL